MSIFSPKPKKFAIDYDGTYSDDPEYFDELIARGRERGHTYIIVTARYQPENREDLIAIPNNVMVIYTGMQAKKPFLQRMGIKIDIWIDDEPWYIMEPR